MRARHKAQQHVFSLTNLTNYCACYAKWLSYPLVKDCGEVLKYVCGYPFYYYFFHKKLIFLPLILYAERRHI